MPTGLQVSVLAAAGLPVIVAVPFGLGTPVPVKPIGVTGAGVLLMMMMITEPSRNPAAVGSNRTVNWQEDPW
ncbi:MAG: hypothetical protein WBP81_34980, partial [Solirubrobacteraceae bacterium]